MKTLLKVIAVVSFILMLSEGEAWVNLAGVVGVAMSCLILEKKGMINESDEA